MESERKIQTELFNAISHGFGVLLILSFGPLIIAKALISNHKYLAEGVAFYCFTNLLVFTFSTLYHAFENQQVKRTLRIFDHISIFFLIGGSYVPFILLYTNEPTTSLFFKIQWGLIALGIIKKLYFTGRFRLLSSLIYIFIGGLIFFFDSSFWHKIPNTAFNFIVSGGLLYLFGVFFYQNQKIPYNHFIWHLFVLSAAICNFIGVWLVV